MIAHQQPGEVVWADCRHHLADRFGGQSKFRPMILVRRIDGHWLVVGLTTQPFYSNGMPRTAVSEPRWAGLRSGPSYFWSENMVTISALDVGGHIGWAHPAMVEQIEEAVRLNATDRASLRQAVVFWADAVAATSNLEAGR